MKIVFLDAFTLGKDIDYSALEKLGEVITYDRTPTELVVERAQNADIILTNKCVLTAETIAQLPRLKLICVTATGYNVVDVVAARAKEIPVTNVKSYGSMSVAQHVFALLLAITNQVAEHSLVSDWVNAPDWTYAKTPFLELAGKTIGIVGFGDIGQKVAQIAEGFEMKVLYAKRTPEPNDIRCVDIETLLKESDVVSLHCPLTADNAEMIHKGSLQLMKPSAILINTARGGLINEVDLAEALTNRTIAAAALDVLSVEPPTISNPLISAKNCLLTPHIAWATVEARTRLLAIVVENIKKFKEGKPQNVVN